MKAKPIIIIAVVIALIIVAIVLNKRYRVNKERNNAILATDAIKNQVRAIENECESLFNTQAEVDACVAQKLAA